MEVCLSATDATSSERPSVVLATASVASAISKGLARAAERPAAGQPGEVAEPAELGASAAWLELLAEPPPADISERSVAAPVAVDLERELAATLAARSFLHNIVLGAILKDQSRVVPKAKAKPKTALHRAKTLATPGPPRSLADDSPACSSRSRSALRASISRETSPEDSEKRKSSKLKAPKSSSMRSSFSSFDRPRAASFLLPMEGREGEVRRPSVGRVSARNSSCATPNSSKNIHKALAPQVFARRLSLKLKRSASITSVPAIKAQKFEKDREDKADSDSNSEAEQLPDPRRKRGKSPKPDAIEPKADSFRDGDVGASAMAAAETLPPVEAEPAEAAQQWPLLTQPQALPVGGPLCFTLDAGSLGAVGLGGLCLEAEVPSMMAGLFGFPQFHPQLYAAPAQISGDVSKMPSVMGPSDYWGAAMKSGSEERADMSVPAYASRGESNPGWDWNESREGDGFEQDVAFSSSSPGLFRQCSPPSTTSQGLASVITAPGGADPVKKDASSPIECSTASAAERASVAPHAAQGVKPPPGPCTTKGRPMQQLAGRPVKSARPVNARAGKSGAGAGTGAGGMSAEKEAAQASDQASERLLAKNFQLSPMRRRRPQPTALAPVSEDVFIYTLPSVDRGAAPAKSRGVAPFRIADAGNMGTARLESAQISATASVGSPGMSGEKDADIVGLVDSGAEADGTSDARSRMALARNRSFKLFTKLDASPAEYRPSSSGRPRKTPRPWTEPVVGAASQKGALAPLNPHDSARSLATVRTVSTSAGGTNSLASQASSQRLLKAAPENTRLAQRARLRESVRERGWDASFATIAGSGILSHSSLGSLDSGEDGEWPGWGFQRRANTAPTEKRNLIVGDVLTYSESEELAASWALALARSPSMSTMGTASASRPATAGLGATDPLTGDMSPLAYHSSKDCLLQEYLEWNGSHLHDQYLTSLREKLQDSNKDDAMASGHASLQATQVQLEQSHGELRELLRSLAEGSADLGVAWASGCQKHVEVLWEELQVCPRARRPALKRSYAGQADEDMARATGEHAQELLSYRDATVRIISGLVERDHLMALLGKDSATFPADDSHVHHLAEIDTALATGLARWCLNFGHFAQLGDHVNRARPHKRAAFLWCGQDALEVIRGSAARVGTASSSASHLTSGLGQASPFLSIMPVQQSQSNFRAPGYRCKERAARSGSRALRSLLRGGGRGGGPEGQKLSPQGSRPNTSPWTGVC